MSGWISAKDRLPDKEGEYLTATTIYNGLICYEVLPFAEIGKKKKRRMAFHSYDNDLIRREENVDAWMQIEPYERGKQE